MRVPLEQLARLEVAGPDELRAWLERNHGRAEGVRLVRWRKGRGPTIDDVEIDADRSLQPISPRRPGSARSAINKRHTAHLLERELMNLSGPAAVNLKADSPAGRDAGPKVAAPGSQAAAALLAPAARARTTRTTKGGRP